MLLVINEIQSNPHSRAGTEENFCSECEKGLVIAVYSIYVEIRTVGGRSNHLSDELNDRDSGVTRVQRAHALFSPDLDSHEIPREEGQTEVSFVLWS